MAAAKFNAQSWSDLGSLAHVSARYYVAGWHDRERARKAISNSPHWNWGKTDPRLKGDFDSPFSEIHSLVICCVLSHDHDTREKETNRERRGARVWTVLADVGWRSVVQVLMLADIPTRLVNVYVSRVWHREMVRPNVTQVMERARDAELSRPRSPRHRERESILASGYVYHHSDISSLSCANVSGINSFRFGHLYLVRLKIF